MTARIVCRDSYCTHHAAEAEGDTPLPVRAPFGYYGAKVSLVGKFLKELPPHNAWVEAFCGSAALTLAKPPAPIEVINDLDKEVVNLFEQLRDNPIALCQAVALTPYAREEFERAKEDVSHLAPLERARRFLIATMMTVNATYGSKHAGFSYSQSYARQDKEARVSRWYNLPERLEAVVERLRRVRIENRDARDLVDMFADRPATLIYMDPPYFVRRDHKYVIDANDEEFHLELLSRCQKSRSMLLLSAYENDLYETYLNRTRGWTKTVLQTTTRDTNGTVYPRLEVLWMNKHFIRAQETGRVPIRLSRKEKSEGKVNPPRRTRVAK